MSLVNQFSAYSQWRDNAGAAVMRLREWLNRSEIGDVQSDMRLQFVLDHLHEDKLVVAFVAEFSRGKSELINAIFFSDLGDRVLPSSAGRTTMCPTELEWVPGEPPEIRLLPIETREKYASVAELKAYPDEWRRLPLQAGHTSGLQKALGRVSDTRRVTLSVARKLGFNVGDDDENSLKPDIDGLVEIPRWRHAVIRYPHPLLEKGLVVLDTPGLNAIGAEPELTLSLLPNAHAVMFILAADTGVTQSDLTVWRDYVSTDKVSRRGRMVVLNKIDGLWDGLRGEAQINAEINRQMHMVSKTLDVPLANVFPVSAQKGLVGRINDDAAMVLRSRLPALERALSDDLLPTKQEIVRERTMGEISDLVFRTRELLDARIDGVHEQLQELIDLRGKNQSVIEYMMRKIRAEKNEFEKGLQKYYAVRSVFSNLTNNLLTHLGIDSVRDETRRTREAMNESTFSQGLRSAMENFFAHLRNSLAQSNDEIAEITQMLDSMYRRFSVEHGLKLTPPESFSTLRYEKELNRLEAAFNRQFNTTLTLVTTGKQTLTQKFFDTIAVQARHTFEIANRDVERWLRAVMSPLETQVREYQLQLKRRLESIKRIHQATGTLEERVNELTQSELTLLAQVDELTALDAGVRDALNLPPAPSRSGGGISKVA